MNNQNKILVSLMLATIVNVMDFNLMMFLLLNLIKSKQLLALAAGYETIFYCLAIGAFEIGSAAGSIFLGAISDIYGRPKVILGGVFLSAISYFIALTAVIYHIPQLFLLSRLFSGISTGNDGAIDAALIENSLECQLKRNVNLIQAITAFGFLLGPFIINLSSYLVGDNHQAYKYSILVGAVFVTLIAFLIKFLYPLGEIKTQYKNPLYAIKNSHFSFTNIITSPYGRTLFFLNFIFVIAQVLYDDNIFLILVNRCNFSPIYLSRLSLVISAGYLFNNLILQRMLNKFDTQKILYTSSCIMFFLTGLCILYPNAIIFSWTFFLQGIIQNTFHSHLLITMARQFKTTEFKGSLMGIIQGVDGMASTFSSMAISSLVEVNDLLPFVISLAFLLLLISQCRLLKQYSYKK